MNLDKKRWFSEGSMAALQTVIADIVIYTLIFAIFLVSWLKLCCWNMEWFYMLNNYAKRLLQVKSLMKMTIIRPNMPKIVK